MRPPGELFSIVVRQDLTSLLQYLDKIGEQFFGIKQPRKPGAAGGLLGLLSGGGGESNGVVGK